MKTALVLEGGAMRGIYTTGVLDVFLDNGIKFDGKRTKYQILQKISQR